MDNGQKRENLGFLIMDEEIAKQICEQLRRTLTAQYGYCGVMICEKYILLNSGAGNLIVNIKWD